MHGGDRRLSGDEFEDVPPAGDGENPYKFKWFASLTRRKNKGKQKQSNKENHQSLENHVPDGSLSAAAMAVDQIEYPYRSNSIFYTLRKRFKRRYSRPRKSDSLPTFHPHMPVMEAAVAALPAAPTSSPPQGLAAELETGGGAAVINDDGDHSGLVENVAEEADRTSNIYVNMNEVRDKVMKNERTILTKHGWYWGPLSRNAAQKRLTSELNGSFLLRDSQTDKYQFTLSFRSAGCTLHSRIDYRSGYWHIESDRYKSIVDLIEDTMRKSKSSVFCYVKSSSHMLPPFPVRLTIPINRFYEVTSLQHLCRFIIRQKINLNNVEQLPLPTKLKDYIRENFYENL